MKIMLICLLIFVLPQGVQALTLPLWLHVGVDEELEPRIYLTLGVSRYLRLYTTHSEEYQAFGQELRLDPFSFWHRESLTENRFGVKVSKQLWKKLHLSLSYQDDQSMSFHSSYRLGHRWSIGVSAYGKDEYKGRAWVAYGVDLADFLPPTWFEAKPKEIQWQNF